MYQLIDLLVMTLSYIVFFFIIAKASTLNWQWSSKEAILFTLAGLGHAGIRIFILRRGSIDFFVRPLTNFDFMLLMLLYIPFLFYYFNWWRKYPTKYTIMLVAFIFALKGIADYLIERLLRLIMAPEMLYDVEMSVTSGEFIFRIVIYQLLVNGLFAILLFILIKSTKKLRGMVREDRWIQNLLFSFCILPFIFFLVILVVDYFVAVDNITQNGRTLKLLAIVPIFCVIAFIYVSFLYVKYEQKRKEDEHESLQYYITELERHQAGIRKFKHDYQNILLSMRGFVQDKDWVGLEQYYLSKVEVVSGIINQEAFALNDLSKIKVSEIKSIFVAKLMLAQNMDLSIDIAVEVEEEVDYINLDSVVLVRMLGIILDNAIEALTELGKGKLFIGCFRQEAELVFVIQNTCQPVMPTLQQLQESGFSTKGENRGLGLSNLAEFVMENPNVTLRTIIKEGNFTQELTIEENPLRMPPNHVE